MAIGVLASDSQSHQELGDVVITQNRLGGVSVVAVASATAGAGSSSRTAADLAKALARRSEGRVLLVEAHLHSPSIAKRWGVDRRPGLVDALVDVELDLDRIVRPCRQPRLSVIPGGRRAWRRLRALRSHRLGELMETARRRYDFVILDAPSFGSLPDARVITRQVHGLFLVVEAHRTPRRVVERALRLIDPVKLLGLVFECGDPVN